MSEQFWERVLIAVLTALAPVIAALAAWMKARTLTIEVKKNGALLDGKMDALLEATAVSAERLGEIRGAQHERARLEGPTTMPGSPTT